MVALTILGCLVVAFLFMILTVMIKGASAIIDTITEMADILAVLILGGIGMAGLSFLVSVFDGALTMIIWAIVSLVIICAIFGSLLSLAIVILQFALTIAASIVVFVFGIVIRMLDKLGELSERALKYFIGIINEKIVIS